MKMKQAILITLAFVIVFALMVGCSNNELDLIAVEVGEAYTLNDGGESVGTLQSPTKRIFNNTSAPKTKTVEFEGKTYIGTYDYSYYDAYYIELSDSYAFDGGDFCVSAYNGGLTQIYLSSAKNGNKTKEDCGEIATKLAQKYINIEDFVLNVTSDGGGYHYVYCYTRYINEIQTGEELRIIVTTDGQISLFSHNMLGMFDKVDTRNSSGMLSTEYISQLSSSKAENLVLTKAQELYPDKELDFKIKRGILVAYPDGTVGMVYHVSAERYIHASYGEYVVDSSSLDIVVKEK